MSKELQSLIIKIDKSHWEKEKEKNQINRCIDVIKERELKAQKYDDLNNSNPNEVLECLDNLENSLSLANELLKVTDTSAMDKYITTIKQALLKAQEQEKENQELLQTLALFKQKLEDTDNIKVATIMMKQLDTNISLEKENAELKAKAQKEHKALEILKSKKYIPLDRINPRFWFDKKIYDETCDYEFYLWLCEEECEYVVKEGQKLTQEEFDLLKRWLE